VATTKSRRRRAGEREKFYKRQRRIAANIAKLPELLGAYDASTGSGDK
jgi:hypothetical protein